MNRRRFAAALGGTAATWPLTSGVQAAATQTASTHQGQPAAMPESGPALQPPAHSQWKNVQEPFGAIRAAMQLEGKGFDTVWRDPRFELQLVYTRIDRQLRHSQGVSATVPRLTHFRFGIEPQRWFAPASLVKLPVAALALERVSELASRGASGLTRDTPFALRSPLRCMQASAAESESVARAIRRMFVVSENEPFNRLYELLGQNRIHQRFAAMSMPHSRVINRIAPCSAADNRVTGAVEFIDAGQRVVARLEGETAQTHRFPHGKALKGRAWVEGGKTIPGPRDFSDRNFMPLDEAHRMVISLVLPEAVPASQRFALDADALVFLRQCMGMLPSECIEPVYSRLDYPDSYAKYLLGGSGLMPMPVGVRSFNKVGRSFGYLSDCAYIVDAQRGAEFFLSASVYVNEADVLNDGRYEYKETGWPFLAALGRAALEVDAARPRAQPSVRLDADGRFWN